MHLLSIELEEDEYSLIGIYSTEEDYRLAYLINKHLNTKFTRYKLALDFENSTAEFPLFEYKDENSFVNYYLINNKHKSFVKNQQNAGLFGGNYSTISYLIPEQKKIDFFLKIEGDLDSELTLKLVEELNKITQIITAYSIEPTTIKSKNHLIF
jgi:hypothetical protein